jgi:DNA-binding transcriptional LysR family regulator
MLRDLELAQETVRALHTTPGGAIRIVAPRSFGTLYLSDAVAQFSAHHPTIHITLILNDTSANASNFTTDDFDVAIRLSPLSERSSVIARKIGSLEWIVCAAPAYLSKLGNVRIPADLSRANCLLQAMAPGDVTWRFGAGNKIEDVKVSGTFRSNSVLALKAAALAGLGVAQLPTCYVSEDLARGCLKRIMIEPSLAERPVYVLLPDNRRVPKSTQIFVRFIAKWYATRSWESSP